MSVRISKVHADRVPAVLFLNPVYSVHYFVERFVPGNWHPTITQATHRLFQPIGVIVQVLERRGFRTHVPSAEDVSLIAAYRHDFFAGDLDLQAAHRFTEVAGSVVSAGLAAHRASIAELGTSA